MLLLGYLLLFFAPLFLFLILRHFIEKKEMTFSPLLLRILFILLCVFLTLFITSLIIVQSNIYFKGYRSHSIIFILTIFFGFIYFLLRSKNARLPLLLIFLRLSILVGTFLASVLVWEISDDYKKQLYYNDDRFRLEDTNRGIMSICGLPDLFVKDGLFESRYPLFTSHYTCLPKDKMTSISIKEEDGIIKVFIYHTVDTDGSLSNPIIATARNYRK
jgi:hypothetical protein